MDEFIIHNGYDLYLNKQYSDLYSNKISSSDMQNLFKHPLEKISVEDDYDISDLLEFGGKKSSKIQQYLKIFPTFINIIKGRIIYQGKTKLSLEKIKPVDKKGPVVLGTVIELNKIKKNLNKENLTKKDIMDYIMGYDIIPLIFNLSTEKGKEIVYKNKKNTFLNKESKLCFITFTLSDVENFYIEVPTKDIKIQFENIDDIIKEKKYIVAHYIYDNFFFLTPTHNLKINNFYMIDIGEEENKFEIKENKDFKYTPNNRKINLREFQNIISKAKNYLYTFG